MKRDGWVDETLAKYSIKECRALEFLKTHAPCPPWLHRTATRVAVLSLSCLLLANGQAAENPLPPVILISVDTLRADRLSCYGYKGLRTPNIDVIARGGTLFSQVSSQVPLTLPSHVSMLTSTYPFVNGIEDNGQPLASKAVTLASILKWRGYRTAAFVGGFVLDRRFGLHQGFDLYDSSFELRRHRPTDPGDIKRFGEDVVRSATEWIKENSRVPFFVFLHLYDLHTPYEVPPSWRGNIRNRGYDTALAYEDEVIGRFWKFLVQQDLVAKSLVVFTSDHGESLGEHGESTHGYFIYQSTLRVPLLIHWPAGTKTFTPQVDEPASLLDLAPTILEFLSLPLQPQFQGRGLLGLVHRQASSIPSEIYSESLYARNHFGCSSLRSLQVGRYKYIEAPTPEFYDLSQDPGETRNLYSQRRELALSYRERLGAVRSRFQTSSAVRSRALSPEAVAALRSLGYVAASGSHSTMTESEVDPKDRIKASEGYGRALALAASGRITEANARLVLLCSKFPEISDIRISLGVNHQKLGRHLEATKNFQQVLKHDPFNVLAHFNLAVSYYELKQLDQATKELEAVLTIAPYYARAEELMGTISLQEKNFSKARIHFQKLLTQEPNNYAGHYNLGTLATLEGRWQEAEHHLSAAVKADLQSAEAFNGLGSLYLRLSSLEKASQAFSEAIRLNPKFAGAHYNLGLVYRQQKKNKEASEAFRRALALDSQFRPARHALDRLEP